MYRFCVLFFNWLYLRPCLKAFPVFNNLETSWVYLSIDLWIGKFKKKNIERFFEYYVQKL